MKVIKRAIVVLAVSSLGFLSSACTIEIQAPQTQAQTQTTQTSTHSNVLAKAKTKSKSKASTTKVKAKACKHEDSKGPCFWNAKKRGDGKGNSFYVMPSGRVFYDPKTSKKDGYVNANWKIKCPKGETLHREVKGQLRVAECR